jgi:thiamine-monophosphate kinase
MSAPIGEFERIARFFAPLAAPGALGLTDDVALIDGPGGEQYVLTTDAIVEGVHFLADDPPDQVARKLLRVNLSDLAGKGARPIGYLLTTALPQRCGEDWLAAFVAGLAADQATYGIGLLGGDSTATSGPVTLSVTAIGSVARGAAVLRSTACPGDLVFVSGTLGDAALGLRVLRGELSGLDAADRDFLVDRYRLPQPRLELGRGLVGLAQAMTDVSDGLVADLGHICETSGVGATIEEAGLPLSHAALVVLVSDTRYATARLGGGDDYELLLTAPASKAAAIGAVALETGVPIACIGRIEGGSGVRVLDAKGRPIPVPVAGYQHF